MMIIERFCKLKTYEKFCVAGMDNKAAFSLIAILLSTVVYGDLQITAFVHLSNSKLRSCSALLYLLVAVSSTPFNFESLDQ